MAPKCENEKIKLFTDFSFSKNRGGSPKIVINDEEGDIVGKSDLILSMPSKLTLTSTSTSTIRFSKKVSSKQFIKNRSIYISEQITKMICCRLGPHLISTAPVLLPGAFCPGTIKGRKAFPGETAGEPTGLFETNA